jgi:hypothetical protein
MSDYIEDFNNLTSYVPEDVDTDAKRKERFFDGFNDELAVQLSVVHVPDFQTLMDKARILEGKKTQAENRKRKHNNYNSEPHQRTRTLHDGNGHSGDHKNGGNVQNNNGGNGHNHNSHKSHNQHNSERGNGHNHRGNNGGNNNGFSKKDLSLVECYKCHKMGHYSNDCPEKKDKAKETNQLPEGHVNHINMGGT